MVWRISSWPETSERVSGRYFSTLGEGWLAGGSEFGFRFSIERGIDAWDRELEIGDCNSEESYQGRVSPALTGRLALLIFLPFKSEEKVTAAGASTESMSISSTSDILGGGDGVR